MFKKIKQILLVSPKRSLWAENPKLTPMFNSRRHIVRTWYAPPLSLLTVAALTPKEIKVHFIDEDFSSIEFNRDYDLIGISAMTKQAIRAYEIGDRFMRLGIPVVIGGIHASVLPEETLNHANSVVIGECEFLWELCLKDYENGTPKKIYKNPKNRFDLKDSVIPRFDLIDKSQFKKRTTFLNMIPIQASRGCPHDCVFCTVSTLYGKKIRKKKISQIIDEIKIARKHLGHHHFLFADDNLFADKKFAEALIRELIPLRITWLAQSDVSIANHENLLRLAYLSGCSALLIGFESLNESNLFKVNKSKWKYKQIKNYDDIVQKIQKNGIIVYCAFIIGFDHDEKDVFQNIKEFMIRNHCVGQFTILTPLPGTKLYSQMKEQKRLKKAYFWNECDFFDVNFIPKNLTAEEIERGIVWLYNEVFNEQEFTKRFQYMKNIYKSLPSQWTSTT